MTRIALDTMHADDFNVHVFDATNIDSIAHSDELYTSLESGWPVVINNLIIPGLDYDY